MLINRYNDEPIGQVLAELVQTSPELVVQLTDAAGSVRGNEVYSRAWDVLQEPTYGESLRFRQPVPLLPDELAVGVRRDTVTTYDLPGSSFTRRWQASLEAVGWERIQVPAGQFDCLRIERSIAWDHYGQSRFAARRIETLWYAPLVNRWVLREWTGFYQDETTADTRWLMRPDEREDSVRWALTEHIPAPIA